MNGLIYAFINKENWKMYVGQTTRDKYRVRMNHHFSSSGGGTTIMSHAIRKYGKDGFEIVTLEEGIQTQEELDSRESYYIDYYNTFSKNGYNMTTGGQGSPGAKRSESAKKAISKHNPRYWKGKNLTDECKAKISQTLTGKVQSEETKAKRAESLKKAWAEGRHKDKHSEESKRLISKNNKMKKKVRCIETCEVFDSITLASKSIKRSVSFVSVCVNKGKADCNNNHWELYKEA